MTSETDKVAIIIPAYNAERFISACLLSVQNQTMPSWQCTVVDDGSADGTAETVRAFVRKDDRFHLIRQHNQGVASARNNGYRSAQAEFMMFLDADDVLESDSLECLIEVLNHDQAANAAHGRAVVIDPDGRPSDATGYEQRYGSRELSWRKFPLSWLPQEKDDRHSDSTGVENLLLRNSITTPGQVLMRSSCLDRVGGFDPSVTPAEDWDMWIRIASISPIARSHSIVLSWRFHPGNASQHIRKMRAAELAVRSKATSSNNETTRRLARLGTRLTEAQRLSLLLRSAVRHVTRGRLRAMTSDLLRAGSSVRYIVLTFAPKVNRA